MISIQIGISTVLIAVTFLVHGVCLIVSAPLLRTETGLVGHHAGRDVVRLMAVAVTLLVAHFISIWLWAFCYLYLDIFQDVETAFYFAGSTYTTLGIGDVLPAEEWRLLSVALANNGMLLFGLSAAILVDASAKLRQG